MRATTFLKNSLKSFVYCYYDYRLYFLSIWYVEVIGFCMSCRVETDLAWLLLPVLFGVFTKVF